MEKFIANALVYSLFVVLAVISVMGAIFLPALGIANCILLAAYFFDYNKRVFRKFFISPEIFFRKNMMVTGYHRAAFFSFLISLIANLTMATIRWVQ